jgi:copper chaperone CopZ
MLRPQHDERKYRALFLLNPVERDIIMQTEIVKVTGMRCEGCTSKVAHALNAIAGVHNVVVSLPAGEAAVRYDEHLTSPDQLKSAVKGAGYGVDATTATHNHPPKGGCCS